MDRTARILRLIDAGETEAAAALVSPDVTSEVWWSADHAGGGRGMERLAAIVPSLNLVRYRGYVPVMGPITIDYGEACAVTVTMDWPYAPGKAEEPREVRMTFRFEHDLLVSVTGKTFWLVGD